MIFRPQLADPVAWDALRVTVRPSERQCSSMIGSSSSRTKEFLHAAGKGVDFFVAEWIAEPQLEDRSIGELLLDIVIGDAGRDKPDTVVAGSMRFRVEVSASFASAACRSSTMIWRR